MSNVPKLYRVYCFDIERRTVSTDFLKAANDEEAIAKIQKTDFGSKCEIWDERSLVARLENDRRQGPGAQRGSEAILPAGR
ncbi:MAG: hypothetical protein ACJ8F4_00105 [Sphingomonas sp.]|jgi:hypothetical protein